MFLRIMMVAVFLSGMSWTVQSGELRWVLLGSSIALAGFSIDRLWRAKPSSGLGRDVETTQVPFPPRKAPGIHSIEVHFAEPVMLSGEQHRALEALIQLIARSNTPAGKVHWLSGTGAKPMLSQSDAAFLGKVPDPNAPMDGEPSWDPSVLYYETSSRYETKDTSYSPTVAP